jgi:hypothetical protein
MKKLLVVGVIALFLGLACAPSINADISNESELVEITTKICGLDGWKYTVQLTQEETEEVEQLIDVIERRLDVVETREETVEIFNETVVELDKYGLLGGLSVKQIQILITGKLIESKRNGKIPQFLNKNNFSEGENMYSLVYGSSGPMLFIAPHIWIPTFFIMNHPILLAILDKFIDILPLILLDSFWGIMILTVLLPIAATAFIPSFSPMNLFSYIQVGRPFPASGTLIINGINGKQNYSEDYYGVICGFMGIQIYRPYSTDVLLLGVSYWSKIITELNYMEI